MMKTIALKESLKSFTPPRLNDCNSEALKRYFNNSWDLYEMLFSSIQSDETYYLSPDPLRNPLIFYLGHTAAFYINKFRVAGLIDQGVNEKFDRLFAVGVDPDLPQNLEVSAYWPSVDEVRSYRKTVYNIVHQVIDNVKEEHLPFSPDSPYWAIPMTIEHDRIHFETSSMLIRQLDVDLVKRPKAWNYAPSYGVTPANRWIEMEGGEVVLGKKESSNLYGWDNEYGELKVSVAPFKATRNLISNAEFLNFVNEGGYENREFWTNEGWDWKVRTETKGPKFWLKSAKGYQYRAMFDLLELPLDWPVEVNAHEANAFCAWKGDQSRLLTEAEFNWIGKEDQHQDFDPLFENKYNLDFKYGSPTPVGFMSEGKTRSGFNDIYGNVWDWLQDDFKGLPGFKTHPYYKEFSAPYMDEEHGMMAGGSWVTTGTGASKYYRLWFRRHFFQHAGFRLAKSI